MKFFKTGLGRYKIVQFFLKAIIFIKNPINVEGNKLYLPLSDGWDYINRPKFYHTEVMKENLKAGDAVIDIGACIGFHTVIMAKIVEGGLNKGKVIAIEANKENCKFLEKNIKANGFNNVEILNMAVSDKKGETELYLSYASKLHQLSSNITTKDYIKVKTIPLDELNIKPDFIKIDAMGSEAKIIRGARNTLKENQKIKIIIQYSPGKIIQCGDNPLEPLRFLRETSYKIFEIDEKEKRLKEIKDIENAAIENRTREIFCYKES